MRRACAGSAWAERGAPRIDTDWSEEGTLLHWHDAHPDADRSGLTPAQREIIKRNEGLREAFLSKELPRLGIPLDAKCTIFREREFRLLDHEGEPLMSHGEPVPGHPDLIYWYPDYLIAIIFDSKFGRNQVDAAWMNDQLLFYFVAFCDWFWPETVIVAITQPWAPRPNDFTSAEYAGKDAPEYKQEIIDIIRATEHPEAPRRAGKDQCVYCAANGVCPIAVSAMSDFAVTKVQELSPAQLEMLWEEMEAAANTVKAIKARLKYLVETCPESVPNMMLKSTGNVRMADPLDTFRKLDTEGVLAGTYAERVNTFISAFCKFSVTGFEAYVQATKNLTGKQAEETTRLILGDLLKETPKEKALARKPQNLHLLEIAAS